MSLQARRLSLRNSRISPLAFTTTTSATSAPPPADETEWESEAESLYRPSPRRARTLEPSYLCAPVSQHHHKRGRSSDGSAKYIEYLERQTAELTAQVAGAGVAAKGRKAVVSENRNLRLELAEWEERFEVRVKDETDRRRKIDEALRGAVEELLGKLEECEAQLRAAQAEVLRARNREKELNGVEEENRRLCGRIETLTELLADSTGSQGRRSTVGSPMARRARRVSSLSGLKDMAAQEVAMDSESRRVSKESGSFQGAEDYGITDMDAPMSPEGSTTSSVGYRRLSFGGSPPTSPSPRTRRMRRFPSGSIAPKTLILPSAVVVDSPTFSPSRELFRPSSAHSRNRPSVDLSGRSFSHPNPHRNSLFAELAAADTDSEEEESEAENESESGAPPTTTATAPSSTTEVSLSVPDPSPDPEPAVYFETPTAPSSPVLSPEDYAFSLVADEIRYPTPLFAKVLNHVPSPTSTFVSAKRKAIDMMLGNSARAITPAPITRRSAQLLPPLSLQRTRRTPSTSRKIPFIPAPSCCHECGAPRGGGAGRRKGAVGGMRKRSGSVVQPTGEDGMDVVWLWVRFIIAVVVALGVAVKDGSSHPLPPPRKGGLVGVGDDEEGIDHVREEERSRALKRLEGKR
ncbi:hypothetical protein BZA05DRAFT_421556 [Tricharina praecox]|uniref:uncharacterized protein n=1 Tax=Tricharina praecox TaxID=43433 RepID=UPI00221E483A|nr:uncharacterized protein BZA05DRAFT_421556 [Tricharina praecox]KAI5844871.1 hypothetical protein BZA05DRAFT_421556 [Tricharina praecox]